MQSQTIARRYAKGLLEAVGEMAPGTEKAVSAELDGLVEAIESHQGLRLMVANPAIASAKKTAVFQQILAAGGGSKVVHNFLGIVADKQRLDQLSAIATVYSALVDAHLGIVTAEITTSAPLNPGQVAQLEQSLRDATGGEVQITRHTDPSLIGGVVTRIGDVVYDGSVKGHLERIRQRLESS